MKSTRLWFKRAVAGMATMVVAATSFFVAGTTSAAADENTKVTFSGAELQHVTATGQPIEAPGRQLYVGDFFYLNVAYDASQANPQPGDSFVIELPAQFVNRDAGNAHREIIKPLEARGSDGAAVRAGDCKIEERKITCTFNEAIAGKVDVKGTVQAQIVASDVTTATSSTFRFGGNEVTINHPWGEDIERRVKPKFTPGSHVTKGTKGVSIASKELNWFISFGGKWLAKNYPAGGPITITDDFQAGMELPALKTIALYRFSADPVTGEEVTEVVARADGSAQVDGFSVTPTFEGNRATFVLTGPFNPEHDYRLNFDTTFTGGTTIVPGFAYRNKATFVEAGVETREHTRTYFESFRASVDFSDGFGGFEITKDVTGDAVPAANQKFTVTVAYTLPDGKTVADYPTWQNAPTSNPITMEITAGHTTNSPVHFPVGTQITLTEDVASANPAPSGFTWAEPKFSSADSSVKVDDAAASATFTVANRKSTPVKLTNTTVADPVPPATPEPSVPATPEPSVPASPEPSVPASPEPTVPVTPEPTAPATSAAPSQPVKSEPKPVLTAKPSPVKTKPGMPATGN